MVHDPEEGANSGLRPNPVSDAASPVKLPFPFHPLFFGAYAVLRLYAENLAVVPLGDLWRPLAATILLTFGLWLVAGLVLRDIRRGALVASALVAILYAGASLVDELGPTLTYVAMALASVLAGWKWRRSPTFFFNMTGAVLAVMVIAQSGYRLYRVQQTLASLGGESSATAANTFAPKPDIFYIILDGYGRSDALRHYIGLDNSEFINGLKARGFYVAERSHSNYSQTEQSLSSSLNLNYLSELVPQDMANEVVRKRYDRLIDENKVSHILRSRGYRFVALTTGFDSVDMKSADVRYENNGDFSLFETTLLNATPFSQTVVATSQFETRRKLLLHAFDQLGKLGQKGVLPRFVFAHILAPHPPFVLNADGSLRPKDKGPYGLWDGAAYMRVGGNVEQYRQGYAGQATYVGKRILEAVDLILKSQKTRPVIIIQGDHGSKTMLDDESLAKTDVREVFRNLNAYLVPESVRAKLYPQISPVNSFRLVLSELFGENLPMLPDRSFYSTWDTPSKMVDVTDRIEVPLDK